MIAFVIEGLRVLLLIFAGYCLAVSARGWWAVSRGSDSPMSMNRAATFWTSLGILISQLSFLAMNGAAPASPQLLLGLLVFVVGYALHARLYWRAAAGQTRVLEKAMERPDLALVLVELAEHDEATAADLARIATRALAEARS